MPYRSGLEVGNPSVSDAPNASLNGRKQARRGRPLPRDYRRIGDPVTDLSRLPSPAFSPQRPWPSRCFKSPRTPSPATTGEKNHPFGLDSTSSSVSSSRSPPSISFFALLLRRKKQRRRSVGPAGILTSSSLPRSLVRRRRPSRVRSELARHQQAPHRPVAVVLLLDDALDTARTTDRVLSPTKTS